MPGQPCHRDRYLTDADLSRGQVPDRFKFDLSIIGVITPTPNSFSFWSARKKTESKERPRKRPELRGRNTNSSNHSMNSLRSNSISYFVAQIANAIRDSISIQRICITLKTSSCGMFSLATCQRDRYLTELQALDSAAAYTC